MAYRPIFIPVMEGNCFVETRLIEFKYFNGFSVSQKQKSIESLHDKAKEGNELTILEISSKSKSDLGVNLSAFNLLIETVKNKRKFTVESAFQASKVFEGGGPYVDLLNKTSREAKSDKRLTTSGRLKQFNFYDSVWGLEPKTAFYDWLYINALIKSDILRDELLEFDAFTDIEFNLEKSINCQAYSAALFVSLTKRGLINDVFSNKEKYIKAITSSVISNSHENNSSQSSLL
jgi:hypothetical protein